MFKKVVSHIGIYLIIINFFSNILFINNAYTDNLIINTQKNTKSYIIDSSKKLIVKKQDKNYSKNNVIVKFKKNSWVKQISDMKKTLQTIKGSNFAFFSNIWIWVVWINNKTKNVEELKNVLEKLPDVEYVDYDYKRKLLSYSGVITNDTYSINQWYLKSIQADDAWKIYNDNENYTLVSVNDSWVDYNHPDLITKMKDLSTNCISDTWSIIAWWCPYGWWNFEGSWAYDPISAILLENDNFDLNKHWTHVAWIIWAQKDNNNSIVWVTQNVEIMSSRLETYENNQSIFYISNTIRAINFAIENWAKIINASYGWSSYSSWEYDAINTAKSNGLLFIAAAWNDWTDNDWWANFYPSDYNLDNIISVASVWEDDTLAYYSNYWNTSVDVAAPWWDITKDIWIYSLTPWYETIFSNDMNSFSWITTSWTWLSWNIYWWDIIETQSWAYLWNTTYTWSENKTLTFDDKFDLSWAKFAKFQWHIECELQAWDDLNILINWQSIWLAYPYLTYGRSISYWDVIIPIPSNLYNSSSELSLNFTANSDNNYNYWCSFDNLKIIKYYSDQHWVVSLQWTSMAAPVVTGLASMIWSYKPDLTYLEVKDIIFSSVDVLWSLNTKVLTSGKVNAKNAIKETIRRYWITKNWIFEWENFSTSLINLTWKNISLSGSTLNITSTWNVVNLGGSIINWYWTINLWTWTNINNFNTSNDFNIVLKNASGTIINDWETVYWENFLLGNIWTYTWTSIDLDLTLSWTNLYNWEYVEGQVVSFNNDFSWSINTNVYKNWYISEWIGSWVLIQILDNNILSNVNFVYTPSIFTWSINFNSWSITAYTWTYINLTSTHYPVDYQITWDIVKTYTWTLNSSWSIFVELTSWDWNKTLSWVLENLNNQFSFIFTWSIILDQTEPTVTLWADTSTWTVTKSIEFNVSSWDSDFDTWSIIWLNNLNSYTWTWLTYIVSWETSTWLIVTVNFADVLDNTWASISEVYIIDNMWPEAPTNLFLNDGWTINIWNEWNLELSGSWKLSESWATTNYIFEDSLAWIISWVWNLSWDSFYFSWLNFSGLSDWTVNYSVYFTDVAWNTWSISTWTTTKETTIPTWSITLWTFTNSTWFLVNLEASEYPIDYVLTWNIVWTYIWTLNSSWSVLVELISWDWEKEVGVTFEDLWNNLSDTYTWSIILDQTNPIINILSHNNNDQTEWSTIMFTWTVSDVNWLDSLLINWTGTTIVWWAFSTNIAVNGWNNIISYSLLDNVWNTSTWAINIVRTSVVSNIYSNVISTWSVDIIFETYLTSTGEVLYWTGVNNLNLNANSISWTNHNIWLNGLLESTQYFYKVRWYNNSYTWLLSSVNNFTTGNPDSTPEQFTFTNVTNSELNTGYISNSITVTWINTLTNISISNWYYSINSWAYTSWTGIVNNWDSVIIKIMSSASHSTKIDSILTIWWVSDTYSVTTKAAVVSSGWWGGWSWGYTYPICLDTQLICKQVAWSYTLFKLYKKEWEVCDKGNLWKECDINNEDIIWLALYKENIIKKLEPTKYLEKKISLKNKTLQKILNFKKLKLINIDENLSGISYIWEDLNQLKYKYRNEYYNWLKSMEKVEKYLTEKNIEWLREEFRKFLKIYENLKKYKKKITVKTVKIDWKNVKYIEYNNKTIKKIYKLLIDKTKQKKEDTYIFRLVNKITYNLNAILTDKSLSKKDIELIRKNTITLYKEFIIEIEKLPKKESVIEKITTINSERNKIKTLLKYFYAMLEQWDTVEVLNKNNKTWLLKVKILTSRIKNYIWREWYIYRKFFRPVSN